MSEVYRKGVRSPDKPLKFFTRILESPLAIQKTDRSIESKDPLVRKNYSTDITDEADSTNINYRELIQGLNQALLQLKDINEKIIGNYKTVNPTEINQVIPQSIRDMVVRNITEESSGPISLETLRSRIQSLRNSMQEESGILMESRSYSKSKQSCCSCQLI